MTIDKTFDRSSLCTTHMELDVRGKRLWSNRSDATEIYLRHSGFHPCEGPDQQRMLIVSDNFKENILSCEKTSETFIHGKQTCLAISRGDVI